MKYETRSCAEILTRIQLSCGLQARLPYPLAFAKSNWLGRPGNLVSESLVLHCFYQLGPRGAQARSVGKIGILGLSDPNFFQKWRFMASLLISKDCITTCCNYVVTLTITRLPSVVILENIHSQGSKIIQILAKLEVQCTWYNAVCDDFIQGCLGEAPFIVCTSNPTEYISDLSQVILSTYCLSSTIPSLVQA